MTDSLTIILSTRSPQKKSGIGALCMSDYVYKWGGGGEAN